MEGSMPMLYTKSENVYPDGYKFEHCVAADWSR
jgi:hypothetical protein